MNAKINHQSKIFVSISNTCDGWIEAMDEMIELGINVNQTLADEEIC